MRKTPVTDTISTDGTGSRPGRVRRPVAAIVAAGAMGLMLTGCTAAVSAPSATTTITVSAPASASASASEVPAPPAGGDSDSPASTRPSSSPGDSSANRCSAAHLRGSLVRADGAAGRTGYDLQLQNTGVSTCTLQGWPGVSFISTGGDQIGAAADFDRSSAHTTVTLQPNAHAHAQLLVGAADDYPAAKCQPTRASRIRVYPPGSKQSITVPGQGLTACTTTSVHLLTVQALHATT